MAITSVNVRNQFKGVINEIVEGPVVSEIDVETKAGFFTSVITHTFGEGFRFKSRFRGGGVN